MISASYESVEEDILNWISYIKDPRMDGFSTWYQKQKLYRVQKLVNELLDDDTLQT
jgi:hypothetical protein